MPIQKRTNIKLHTGGVNGMGEIICPPRENTSTGGEGREGYMSKRGEDLEKKKRKKRLPASHENLGQSEPITYLK